MLNYVLNKFTMKPFRIVSNGIPLYIAAFVRQHSHIPWCAPKHSIANWMCATMYWNAKLILHEICANGGGIFCSFFFLNTQYMLESWIFHATFSIEQMIRIVLLSPWNGPISGETFDFDVHQHTKRSIRDYCLRKVVANWIRYDKMDAKSQSNSNPFDVRLFSCKFIVICFAIFLEWQIPVVHFIRMRITFSSNVVTK